MNKLENYRPCATATPVTAKLLLLVLRDITDDYDQIIIPQRRIAEAIGMSRSAVGRNLHRLERAGAITIEPLYSEYGGRLPNKYRLRRDGNGNAKAS
ncbi:MAG: helix-turn-helix domain-containing protein [Firmicutes bacterium]|nr:helix-turn-helix domain-containing protein [Bacillota bacterium]